MKRILPLLLVLLFGQAALADRFSENLAGFSRVCVTGSVDEDVAQVLTKEAGIEEAYRILGLYGIPINRTGCYGFGGPDTVTLSFNFERTSGGTSGAFVADFGAFPYGSMIDNVEYVFPEIWSVLLYGSGSYYLMDKTHWFGRIRVAIDQFVEDWREAH